MKVETKAWGGILKSLARYMLGSESFFINSYRSKASDSKWTIAERRNYGTV